MECIGNKEIIEYLFNDNSNLFDQNMKFLPSINGRNFYQKYKDHFKKCEKCYQKIRRLNIARDFSQIIKEDIEQEKNHKALLFELDIIKNKYQLTDEEFDNIDYFEFYHIVEDYIKNSSEEDKNSDIYTRVKKFNTLELKKK